MDMMVAVVEYFKISNINSELLNIIVEKCYVIHNGALMDGDVRNAVGYIGTTSAVKLESGCSVRTYSFFGWDTIDEFNLGDMIVLHVLDISNLEEYKFTYLIDEVIESNKGNTVLLTSKKNKCMLNKKAFEVVDKHSLVPLDIINKYLKSKVERFEALESKFFFNVSNVSFNISRTLYLEVYTEIMLLDGYEPNVLVSETSGKNVTSTVYYNKPIKIEIIAYDKDGDVVGTGSGSSNISQEIPIGVITVRLSVNKFPDRIRILPCSRI